tara:strand:- start:145 stop:525 length:381 start_codon:yes stop_codon:yes gene_type:complete
MKKLFVFLSKFIKRIPEFAFKIGSTKKFQIGLTLVLVSFSVFIFLYSTVNYPEDYNRIDYRGIKVTSVGKSVNSYLGKGYKISKEMFNQNRETIVFILIRKNFFRSDELMLCYAGKGVKETLCYKP